MFVYKHQKHEIGWIHVAQYAVQYQCNMGRQTELPVYEGLKISLRTERLSSFLRSTRETFVGLQVLCLYSDSKKSRKSFVGASFAHVDHVNLFLW